MTAALTARMDWEHELGPTLHVTNQGASDATDVTVVQPGNTNIVMQGMAPPTMAAGQSIELRLMFRGESPATFKVELRWSDEAGQHGLVKNFPGVAA